MTSPNDCGVEGALRSTMLSLPYLIFCALVTFLCTFGGGAVDGGGGAVDGEGGPVDGEGGPVDGGGVPVDGGGGAVDGEGGAEC